MNLLTKERDGFTTIHQPMVVCQRDDHDRTNDNLSVDNDGLVLDGVHAEYGSLRQVDNWRAEQATEDATVRAVINRVNLPISHAYIHGRKTENEHGKSATRHIFNGQFAIARLLAEFRDPFLDIQESHPLCIPQYRRDETLGCSNRDAQIDIIAINDRVALDARVRRRDLLEREDGRAGKCGHEPELDIVLLQDLVLELAPHLHERGHVDLVEGRERRRGVLRLL